MPEIPLHPFLQGLSKHRGAPPTVVVIFGASGDLTARKLIPAIYNLSYDNLLPADFHLVGYGRKAIPDEEFRTMAAAAIKDFSRRELDADVWARVAANTTYVSGGYDEKVGFDRLAAHIKEIEKAVGSEVQSLFYISTPPSVFGPIIQNLGASGLGGMYLGSPRHSKVIIEKPFGRDLDSARALNAELRSVFEEGQVYRIDHYLGKETVQDLLVQRFANAIFEPLWNRNYIDSVQITVAEDQGVGTRSGLLRAERVPARHDPEPHDAAARAHGDGAPGLLRGRGAARRKGQGAQGDRADRARCPSADTARAQYAAGMTGGKKRAGLPQEKGIAPQSATETFAALRLSINNWRWQGVPFYLRSRQAHARRVTEIAVQLKCPARHHFRGARRTLPDLAPNTLSFQIQPDEGLSLVLNAKIPGLETHTQPVKMNFRYATTFGSNTPEAYERLVLDAMIGDGTLFIRGDEAETSWRLYTPVLDFWRDQGRDGLDTYPAGSWGPPGAEALLARDDNVWRQP
jgi:glucose-6-phosphate 1-dehydrogenase